MADKDKIKQQPEETELKKEGETSTEESVEKSENSEGSEDPDVTKGVDEESPEQLTPEAAIIQEWTPKTEIGRKVKKGEITDIEEIFDSGYKILETVIVDVLVPNLETDLLLIGQSKGKFGGGQRRVFRQTQKKTKEGNKPKFAAYAVVGNRDGLVGVGYGKARETVPAREKAFRNAKLNLIKIRRGCGSWESTEPGPNSVPFKVRGKCGSVIVELFPAPVGKGLIVEQECQKILALAGIKDVLSKTKGQTTSKINLIKACVKALEQLMEVKVQPRYLEKLGIAEGRFGQSGESENE